MKRSTTTQAYENDQRDILPINLGGTGTTTPKLAVVALGGISQQDLGAINGVASLDGNVKVLLNQLPPINGDEQPAIDGPISTYTLKPTNYVITNYDLFAAYSLSVNKGSVTRNGKNIIYTPSAQTGVAVITVNNTHTGVNVLPSYVDKPVFLSPSNNAVNLRPNTLLAVAAFSCTGFQDTHLSTSWQIASDVAFANIVEESLANTTSLLNYTAHDLTLSNTYYARVKFTSTALGDSVWSDPVQFAITNHLMPENEVAQLHTFPGPLTNGVTGYQSSNYGAYGVDISRDGTVIVTSDPNAFLLGIGNSGGGVLIYNYSNENWIQNGIESNILDIGSWFGKQIAISADKQKILVVSGSVGHEFPTQQGYFGELRIYETVIPNDYSNMVLLATYIPPTNTFLSDAFAQDVSTTPNFETIVVSGYNDYVYTFNFDGVDITLHTSINNPINGINGFGETISINDAGTILVIGSEYAVVANTHSRGLFHVYELNNNTWTLTQVVEADEDAVMSERYFGWPVEISPDGGKIATFSNTHSDNTGHIYLFEKVNNVWTKTKKYDMPEMSDAQLGGEVSSLCFSGDGTLLLAGSPWQSTPESSLINGSWDDTGMAYLFDISLPEISLVHSFIASDASNGNDGEDYGTQVALSYDGSTIAITSPWRNWNNDPNVLGTIYVYK